MNGGASSRNGCADGRSQGVADPFQFGSGLGEVITQLGICAGASPELGQRNAAKRKCAVAGFNGGRLGERDAGASAEAGVLQNRAVLVMVEQLRTLDVSRLDDFADRLDPDEMRDVDEALSLVLALS